MAGPRDDMFRFAQHGCTAMYDGEPARIVPEWVLLRAGTEFDNLQREIERLRRILRVYLRLVVEHEGVNFLEHGENIPNLSPEDMSLLRELDRQEFPECYDSDGNYLS